MPRPVEALPCGSLSISSTRSPTAASAVPRLMAVVVLPTPPFWLAMVRTRRDGSVSRTGRSLHAEDASAIAAEARQQLELELPVGLARHSQLRLDALALEEQADRPF